MRDSNIERISELVNDIYEGELELEEYKRELKLKSKKEELKKLITSTVEPDNTGQHIVIVDGLRAIVFKRSGQRRLNMKKAKELLHPNTLAAIMKIGKAALVLGEIEMVKE